LPNVLALAPIDTVVTSSIDSSGQLQLITWTVGNSGALTRQYTATVPTDSGAPLAEIPCILYPFVWQQGSNNVLDALVFGPSSSFEFGQIAADHTDWSGYTPIAATGSWECRVDSLALDYSTGCDDGAANCPVQLEVWNFSEPAPR
jgi:hypothetical protein